MFEREHVAGKMKSKRWARTAIALGLAGSFTSAVAAFSASLDLSTLNGSTGTRADGVASGDFLGYSVSTTGDLNGDGIADFALGAPSSGSAPGNIYIVFGVAGGLPFPVDLSSLNGSNGFRVDGRTAGSQLGSALAAGDFNHDGVGDVVLGAPGEGAAYVVFGHRGSFSSTISLTTLDGANGFTLQGSAAAMSGYSLGAGDLNGDGASDLIIGNGAGGSGFGYVVFGHGGSAPATIDLGTLNGSDGFLLAGASAGDAYVAVAGAGDVNGDGFGDLLVGSPYAGKAYLLWGHASFGSAAVNLTDPQLSAQLAGSAGSWFGFAVSGAGDVNGDGLQDLVIGAPLASLSAAVTNAGRTYVVFGASNFPATLSAPALNGSNGGFQVSGAVRQDKSGWSVAAAGDINGDGLADVTLGAPYSSYAGSAGGAAYVIFGKTSGFQNLSLAGGLNGSNGFQAVAPAATQAGFSVGGAGDVNGDGMADLIVGGRLASPGGVANAGLAYVVYGQNPAPIDTTPPSIQGTRTPAANAYGWNNSAVSVSFACSDAQSGVKSCSAPVVLSLEGANQSVVGTAVDNAGNTASATVSAISIDLSVPKVVVAGVTAGIIYTTSPTPSCQATDSLSGMAIAPTLKVAVTRKFKGVTYYTASCSGAQDKAGNGAATASVNYGVKR